MDKFCLELHHGGEFASMPMLHYLNGSIEYYNDFLPEDMSLAKLHHMVAQLGYVNVEKLHYVIPGLEFLEEGIRNIHDESHVDDLLSIAVKNHWIQIIVEGGERVCQGADLELEGDKIVEGGERVGQWADLELKGDEIVDEVINSEEESDCASLDDMSSEDEDEELILVRKRRLKIRNKGRDSEGDLQHGPLIAGDEERTLTITGGGSEDEGYSSSDYDSPVSGDEEGEIVRIKSTVESYDPEVPSRQWEPTLGMKFGSAEEFKKAMRTYSVMTGFALKFQKNTQLYVVVTCMPNCPFRIYASQMQKEMSFQIKTMQLTHKCSKNLKVSLCNSEWLAEKYKDRIISNPSWKLEEWQKEVRATYSFDVPLCKLSRARKKARGELEKTLKQHYAKVWDYSHEVKRANPNSTIKVLVERVNEESQATFQRFYVCFDALRIGWKVGYRPVIGVDGCFLKSLCKGELLTAIGRDGNNQMFPIAWAVLEVENTSSWSWFLELLHDDLDLQLGQGLTIISDQQKGLIAAINGHLPYAEHRHCARHIYANFRKKFCGKYYKTLFWKAAKAGTKQDFENVLEELKKEKPLAYEHLVSLQDPKKWSRSHFLDVSKCESVDNNMCECFNGCILDARTKSLIHMLEDIRMYTINRMQKRRELIMKWKEKGLRMCPKIKIRIDKHIDVQRNWFPTYIGGSQFEVKHISGSIGYVVDLKMKTCTCQRWALSGIPCSHSIACILMKNEKIEDYLAEWYMIEKMEKSYDFYIGPLNGENMWIKHGIEPCLPPRDRRMPGRPKKQRIRGANESPKKRTKLSRAGRVISCSKCKQEGHNKSTCKNNEIQSNEKRTTTEKGKSKAKSTQKAPSKGNISQVSTATTRGSQASIATTRGSQASTMTIASTRGSQASSLSRPISSKKTRRLDSLYNQRRLED